MELHSKMDIPDLQPLVWSIMWKILTLFKAGNRNKGKGNGAGLAWESQSHCFADEFGIPYMHSFGTDTTWLQSTV